LGTERVGEKSLAAWGRKGGSSSSRKRTIPHPRARKEKKKPNREKKEGFPVRGGKSLPREKKGKGKSSVTQEVSQVKGNQKPLKPLRGGGKKGKKTKTQSRTSFRKKNEESTPKPSE